MDNIFFSKSSSIKRIALFGLVISLAASLIPCSSVNADQTSDIDIYIKGVIDHDFANEILVFVNEEREKIGLSALVMNAKEMDSANVRARECILRYSHRRPVSADWTSMIPAGYKHAGENLAIGYNNAKDAVKAWMDSPTHKANILGADYKTTGIGVFKYTNSITGKTMYTCAQHFSNDSLGESKLTGKDEKAFPVTIDQDVYPLELELYLDGHDLTTEIELSQDDEIKAMVKVRADDIWRQDFIAAEGETLEWVISDTEIVDITAKGVLTAKGIGRTTVEAVAPNQGYKAILDIVVKRSIYNVDIDSIEPREYTGEKIEPEVSVSDGNDKLILGEDYKVRYSDNIYPGTAKIHISGTGDYGSERVIYFSVYDDSTEIKEGIWKKILRFFGFDR